VKADNTLEEILIFRLSPILGGRTEVLNTSLSEAFTYFSLEQEKKENEKLETFLNLWYANPLIDADKRKIYIDSITPKTQREVIDTKWDYDKLNKYKLSQSG
jgi:hypothetical protein